MYITLALQALLQSHALNYLHQGLEGLLSHACVVHESLCDSPTKAPYPAAGCIGGLVHVTALNSQWKKCPFVS